MRSDFRHRGMITGRHKRLTRLRSDIRGSTWALTAPQSVTGLFVEHK